MIRKLVVLLLIGVVCLLGAASALGATYNEAPMLRTKVAAGELPPVEERLPEEPLVVDVVEEIGQYGGTLITKDAGGFQVITFEPMLHIAPDGKTIVPGIAKDWKFSDGGKTFTLYLRKGMKWSDGVPFTADDILYWWEDYQLNKEFHPQGPNSKNIWEVGGELMKVEKVNNYTVSLHFVKPYPGIERVLTHYWGCVEGFYLPAHYLKKFHIKYNPDADKLAKEEGFDHWYQLHGAKQPAGFNPSGVDPDTPTINSYVLKRKGVDYFISERNPYYWKVDPEGNQLPYIDEVKEIRGSDADVVMGKYGFASGIAKNYPVYMESAEKGNYRVLPWVAIAGSDFVYEVNQTIEDPVLRKIFRDVRFRRALSLAINREEINDMIYFGKGTPRQYTVLPESSYYEEEFAKAYAEYDPEQANRLLDEMGLRWDKNHEYRVRPDGKRLSLLFEYAESWLVPRTPVSELVKKYWGQIGINMTLKIISGDLYQQRVAANKIEIGCWEGAGVMDTIFLIQPTYTVPVITSSDNSWGNQWALWVNTGGEVGEKPIPEVMKNLERWRKMQSTMDKEENICLGKEILRSQAENLWVIGFVGMPPLPMIVRDNLRNVPERGLWGWDLLWACIYHPEQFFLEQK